MTHPRVAHQLREALLELDPRTRRRVLSVLSPAQAARLSRMWRFWARPGQLAPPGDWRFWLVVAGRGFGKTRTAAEWIHERVRAGRARRIALLARDAGDARDVMVEGKSGILATADPRGRPYYEPSKRRVTWPGGARATVFSSEDGDSTRGPEHDTGWCDEYAALKPTTRVAFFHNFDLGLRIAGPAGNPAQAIITTTPRPLDDLIKLRDDKRTVVTTGSTYDNEVNLDPAFFGRLVDAFAGTRIGRQEIDAEFLDDVEGALWTSAIIDACRVRPQDVPDLQRVVVAIDPAATAGANSDETGIIVAGLGVDGEAYVLEDLSCSMRPSGWARRAIDAYDRHGADAIVIETNQGGDMAEETLAAVSRLANVRRVHAAKGKRSRAEPVAALYEETPLRGALVHHVGRFAALEKQQASFTGAVGERSPDRVDALVYAIHELLIGAGGELGIV